MESPFGAQRLLVLLSLVSSAYAYSNHLWQVDFDTFDKWETINNNCSHIYPSALNQYKYESHTFALIDCILEHTSEIKKAELGTVTVMLGLLPVVLQLIGPKFKDLALLATRRPLLAIFLTIGSPCPAVEYMDTGMEEYLVKDEEGNVPPVWPHWLQKRREWVVALIAVIEYAAVMAAAGNVVYQFYRLTFYAVVLISTQLGEYGGTLEAFAPLLWVFLGIPIHALGVAQLWCCRVPAGENDTFEMKTKTLAARIRNEFTPCAFAKDITDGKVYLRNSAVYQFLNWMIKLFIWADVIYGVIVLSTIIFVPMWSAIWMIGLIFTGTLMCRLVLAFEMHGLREVHRPRQKGLVDYVRVDT